LFLFLSVAISYMSSVIFFFYDDTAPTEIYTLSLHDALPIFKSFSGLGNAMVALISAAPYLAASISMVLVANHSDRSGERRWHVALSAFAGCLGLGLSAYFLKNNFPLPAFFSLCLAPRESGARSAHSGACPQPS